MKSLSVGTFLLLLLTEKASASLKTNLVDEALHHPHLLNEMEMESVVAFASKRKAQESSGHFTNEENSRKRGTVTSDLGHVVSSTSSTSNSSSSEMDILTLGSKYTEMTLNQIRTHLRRLGESKRDPIKEHTGWNFLHEAVHTDNIPLARILLSEFDFNPNAFDPYFGSSMYLVQSVKMVELLLEFHGNLSDQRHCTLYKSAMNSARARKKVALIYLIEPLQDRLTKLTVELRRTQQSETPVKFSAERINMFDRAMELISTRRVIHRGNFQVKFEDEIGVDFGGLTSEFIDLIKNTIIARNRVLIFNAHRAGGAYEFLPDRELPPSEQEELNNETKLLGYIFGLCIYRRIPLNIKFAPIIYYIACGLSPINEINFLEVLRNTDNVYLNSQLQLVELPEYLIADYAFPADSRDRFRPWKRTRGNLKGYADLKDYIALDAKNYVYSKYQNSLLNFKRGLDFAINSDSIHEFITPKELEIVIKGETDYTAQSWRSACNEPTHHPDFNEQYEWFWKAVDEITPEQRALLLKFVFSLDSLPIGGFAALPDYKPEVIFDLSDVGKLPRSSTCFYRIYLYSTESYVKMKENLINAAEFGSSDFDLV